MSAMRRSVRPGFTLMEMLVVIAIISVLGGLVLGALGTSKRRADVRQVELTLTLLESKIDQYFTDNSDFPDSGGNDGIAGSERLLEALTKAEKEGPYLNLKEVQTSDENGNGLPEIADRWGKPIQYIHHRHYGREKPNRRTYRLFSAGPDRVFDPLNPEADDIVNWKKGADTD